MGEGGVVFKYRKWVILKEVTESEKTKEKKKTERMKVSQSTPPKITPPKERPQISIIFDDKPNGLQLNPWTVEGFC